MAALHTDRLAIVHSHLDPGAFLLTEFNGTEGLSQLFSFDLELLSKNHDIEFSDIVGRDITVAADVEDGQERFFNGIVSSFSQKWIADTDESGADLSLYSVCLVPQLWLLTRYQSSRIFQDMSVPEIVEQILNDRNIANFRFDLVTDNYDKRMYCVQYRETDYHFVCRLLEDEGIYFYFEHEHGKHTWVLADGSFEHKPCPLHGKARFHAVKGGLRDEAVVTDLVIGQQIRSCRYTLKAFDFEKPNTDLSVCTDAVEDTVPGPGVREIYDYPGTYCTLDQGEKLSRLRIEEEEAQVTTIKGASTCVGFVSGFLFTLERHGRKDMNNKRFLLTTIEHHLKQQGFRTRRSITVPGTDPAKTLYENRFACIRSETPFRPRRITTKPTVQGPQTAIVVGPDGEDIHTDEHGRVKVQFHWDREGQCDENSSCWVRVSQTWAGQGWGGMHIPHVGHEVIVDFLEGDPDRPVVTGRVYHAANEVPESLPDDKHKSILRDDYGNEIVFDATPGDEHIRLHSPHHKSTLTLGRSISAITDSNEDWFRLGNKAELNVGNRYEGIFGNNLEIIGGSSGTVRAGMATEIDIGAKYGCQIGQNFRSHLGSEQNYHLGPRIDRSGSTITSLSKQDNILSAEEIANIVGGAGKKKTSIVEASSEQISLSVGENRDPEDHKIPLWSEVLLFSIPFIVMAQSVLMMGTTTALVEACAHIDDDEAKKVAEGVTSGVATVSDGFGAAVAIIYSILTLIVLHSKPKSVSHFDDKGDKVDAVISLNEKGNVHIYGKDRVRIAVKKDIENETPPMGPKLIVKKDTISMSGKGVGSKKPEMEITKDNDVNIKGANVIIKVKGGFYVNNYLRVEGPEGAAPQLPPPLPKWAK